MPQPWSRIVNSTIRNYISEVEMNILRNRKLPALLQKRGRISFNWSGTAMDWKVRYRRTPMVGFADGDTVTFSRQDHYKTAVLEWRGYSASDAMTKGEFLMNRGREAIINLFDERNKLLMEDVEDAFHEEFYKNGNLAANIKGMHGIESFMGGTHVAGVPVNTPTSTFAGISCVPGNYGGSWSGTWPKGRGSSEYDFWSPIIVDVGSTDFSATATWVANAIEAISFAIVSAKKSPSPKGALDVFMLNATAYRNYVAQLRDKERITITSTTSDLIGLGFKDVVQQDGFDVSWEYGLPTGVIGYGFNVDNMELRSQQAQVWVPEGPSYDDASKTWRWSVDMFGNTVWNPKFQCKLTNTTNSSDASLE